MPTRPSNSPLVATDATISSGPEVGLSTRLSPGAGILAQGIHAGVKLPGRVLSYILGTLGDWANYLDQRQSSIAASNWPERATSGALFSPPAVNSNVALAVLDPGTISPRILLSLSVSKDITRSSDGGITWPTAGNLANASTAKPELAIGQFDGVPVCFTNNSGSGVFYKSVDGSTWTTLAGPAAGLGSGWIPAYSAGVNRLCIVTGGSIYYVTSTTAGTAGGAASWTAATVPGSWGTNSGGVKRVLCNGSLFVALPLSTYDKCLTSSDGITWTERALGTNQLWAGLAYSASEALWMAISDGGAVVTSPDGTTWTVVGSTTTSPAADLAVAGALWVIATRNGGFGGIAYSTDRGVTWLTAVVGNHSVATSGWNRITRGDFRFIVAHQTGASNTEFQLSLRDA